MTKGIKRVEKGKRRPFELRLSKKSHPKAGGTWVIWANSRTSARKKLLRHAKKVETGKWPYSR